MGTVDDPTVIGGVGIGLRTKLKTEVLDDIWAHLSNRESQ